MISLDFDQLSLLLTFSKYSTTLRTLKIHNVENTFACWALHSDAQKYKILDEICLFNLKRWPFSAFIKNLSNLNWSTMSSAGICLFKVNSGNTRTICGICSKLTIKTPEWRHWRRSGVFIVNFKRVWHIVLVFPLLTLFPVFPLLTLNAG